MSEARVGILIEARNLSKAAFNESLNDARNLHNELVKAAGDIKAGVPGATDTFKQLRRELGETSGVSATLRRSFQEAHSSVFGFLKTAQQVGGIGRSIATAITQWSTASIAVGDANRDAATAQEDLNAALAELDAAKAAGDQESIAGATQKVADAQKNLQDASERAQTAQNALNTLMVDLFIGQGPQIATNIGQIVTQLQSMKAAMPTGGTLPTVPGVPGAPGGGAPGGGLGTLGTFGAAVTGVGLGLAAGILIAPHAQEAGLRARIQNWLNGPEGPLQIGNVFIQSQTSWRGLSEADRDRLIQQALEAEMRQREQQRNAFMVGMQRGGIVTRPMTALLGEAGPEAVVPLRLGFGLDRGLRTGGVTIQHQEIHIHVPKGMNGSRLTEELLRELDRRSRP